MNDKKRIPIIIPEGLSWPKDKQIPYIEVQDHMMRRIKRDKDGNVTEEVSIIPFPVLPEDK